MMAAHAAVRQGHDITIISKAAKSRLGGAQYLHAAIPGVTSNRPDGSVRFLKRGTPEVYAEKVYQNKKAETSWHRFEDGWHPIWNLQAAYDRLWVEYHLEIREKEVDIPTLYQIQLDYDLVISSIPLVAICDDPAHEFTRQDVWIYPDATCEDDTIMYSGIRREPWYRQSVIFGTSSTEYPSEKEGAIKVQKPLDTTCDCWPEVTKVGRYGTWQKKVLVNDAFEGANVALHQLQQ